MLLRSRGKPDMYLVVAALPMREASWFSQNTANLYGLVDSDMYKIHPRYNPVQRCRAKHLTSGWRIGTQPASFSYSSITSAILVVNLAKHYGTQRSVETNRRIGSDVRSKRCSRLTNRPAIFWGYIDVALRHCVTSSFWYNSVSGHAYQYL
jgi:hypothetical protein